MAVKAVIDRARATPGCMGIAVFAGDTALYSEAIDPGHAKVLRGLLKASPGARRASAASGGFTFIAFRVEGYVILLKVAGRFPALPGFGIEEPSFVDPACTLALPSRAEARHEAEAALRQFGLL